MTSVLSFDLGTGSCKASIWRDDAVSPGAAVVEYETLHPSNGMQEHRPQDWWNAVIESASALRSAEPTAFRDVRAVVLSGHSLGVLPLDAHGEPLQDATPIWSDTRGEDDAARVFESYSEAEWYLRTGNGFSRGLYPVFKLAWLRRNDPRVLDRARSVVGSKDFVNLQLTGRIATDFSYASGSGAFDLVEGRYDETILAAAGIDPALFPRPVESHDSIGTLTPSAAELLGLAEGTEVFAGGVDNACMAAGSRLTSAGRAYVALGSSSWVTLASTEPVLDERSRPFAFRHLLPGHYISALSTFSGGTSLEWAREHLFGGLSVDAFVEEAMRSPIGAQGITFLPALAGGTPLEGGSAVRGGFLGLSLGHTRADVARAVLEGVSLSIARSLHELERLERIERPVLLTGGGSRSPAWNEIYAAAMDASLSTTTVSQDAATLGAAAAAFVGLGVWNSYADADRAHHDVESVVPDARSVTAYRAVRERFAHDSAVNLQRRSE